MIECTECETGQFLQITRSRIYFDGSDTLTELSERYECSLCGATGGLSQRSGREPQLTGDVQENNERPWVILDE